MKWVRYDQKSMYIGLHVKYLLFLSDFNEIWISDRFWKNKHISNVMKIHPVAAKLFHMDGQTDMMKLTVTFRNFVHVPKREYNYHDLFSETKYGLHDSLYEWSDTFWNTAILITT